MLTAMAALRFLKVKFIPNILPGRLLFISLFVHMFTRAMQWKLIGSVAECTFPLTGQRCVSRIITDIAVFDCTPEGLVLRELLEGMSVEELKETTGAPFEIASDFKTYQI
jgi:acyl CoA:acetate/3-ketoacid CoA transferase beta subunit